MESVTKKMIAVMQAYEDGQIIECRNKPYGDTWVEVYNPMWDWRSFEYRIKQGVLYRPLKKQNNKDLARLERTDIDDSLADRLAEAEVSSWTLNIPDNLRKPITDFGKSLYKAGLKKRIAMM